MLIPEKAVSMRKADSDVYTPGGVATKRDKVKEKRKVFFLSSCFLFFVFIRSRLC